MDDPHADLLTSSHAVAMLDRSWMAESLGRARLNPESEFFTADLDAMQVLFPTRARRTLDCGLAAHEMGHFLTIDEKRCVRDAFDLRFGIPDLSTMPAPTMIATTSGQGISEARAIACETVILEDLLGIDPVAHIRYQCWVLRHLEGFVSLPGRSADDRIAWLTDRTLSIAASLDIDTIRSTWRTRIDALPRLFQQERDRLAAIELPGTIVCTLPAPAGWSATIYSHAFGAAESFVA